MTNKERDGLFRVCVDGKRGDEGTVYTRRTREPFAFADLGDLMLKVERVLEQQDYPQASQEMRSFRPGARTARRGDLPVDGLSQEAVEGARGEKATFDLQITSRRNATWQGILRWSDGTTSRFENDLAFLSLVTERLK